MAQQGPRASTMPAIVDFGRLVRAVENHPTIVYLRYSHGPDADSDGTPSRDYESGSQLPGLSVAAVVERALDHYRTRFDMGRRSR